MFYEFGRVVQRHRRLIIAGWVVVAVISVIWGPRIFDRVDTGMGDRVDVESALAQTRLDSAGQRDPDVLVLFDGRAQADPVLRSQVSSFAAAVSAIPRVAAVHSAADAGGLVSSDGQAQLVTVTLTATLPTAQEKVLLARIHDAAASVAVPKVLVGGPAAFDVEFSAASEQQLIRGEAFAFPLVLILLLLILRGFIGLAVTMAVAVVSVVTTLLALLGISTISTVSAYATNVVTMVGLGLSIDYGLLLISRYREEVAADGSGPEAVNRTMASAGRTVGYSGLTVALALSGLLAFREPLLRSMAWAAIAVALLTMMVSLTLVPALLSTWGHRIRPIRPRDGEAAGGFTRLARFVQRHSAPVALGVVLVLIVLSLPFRNVVLGGSDAHTLPRSSTSRLLAETLDQRFPNAGEPIVVVAEPGTDSGSLLSSVLAIPGVAAAQPRPGVAGGLVVIDVHARGESPQQATDLVRRIRAAEPAVAVTGAPAVTVDFQQSVGGRLPLALAIIALTSMLLLFLMTNSLVVPVKALVMNVLSLGASFGALVWIFQEGHLSGLLDFTPVGSIDSTIPVLIFVFAFGLSMDYEVFLLSRIREVYLRSGDTNAAVAEGLQYSGRIVTSAAMLMIAVFLGFTAGELLPVKELGLGIAIAIAVDATLVRCLLLPAAMSLLGRWNWWSPRWLIKRSPEAVPASEDWFPSKREPLVRNASAPDQVPVPVARDAGGPQRKDNFDDIEHR